MTQKEAIIKALKKNKKGLTDRQMIELGIGRPSARLSELRQDGYSFGKSVVRKTNKLGNISVFYRYTLTGEPI